MIFSNVQISVLEIQTKWSIFNEVMQYLHVQNNHLNLSYQPGKFHGRVYLLTVA